MEMEYGEAKKAVDAYKARTGCIRDAIRELGHVASAAAQARAHLMKKEETQSQPERAKV
ncbi:hypothetical protein [uncultured Desulfovibrio sp.]|uniref:hypothetical protein n=1 Tax=uncultured Desulfovibrio sp. TaxID=167968 RepID=UPI0026DCEF45|nr:hypothetical protein [uncultured Desulfovibrio sp.]